jgi:hypothetical protein
VLKKLVQQGGALLTAAQIGAANAAATAACDVQADDVVTDGIVADPRACTFSATANICGKAGAPAAPTASPRPRPRRSTGSGMVRAIILAAGSGFHTIAASVSVHRRVYPVAPRK